MDEQRQQVLKAELDDAVAQRAELDTYIAVLAKRLGVEVPAQAGGTAESENGRGLTATGDPLAAVHEAQFYGKSAPKASKELLAIFGSSRPMKTQEIYDAITKGGVKIGSSGSLYRSLTRDPDFHKVGRGRWGLTEWYPNAKRGAHDDHEPGSGSNDNPEPVDASDDLGPDNDDQGPSPEGSAEP